MSKEADAEARFKEVAEAYDVLRDPHKRAEYDQVRLYQQQGERFQVPPDWQPGSGDDYSDPHAGFGADYSDFFESLFGAAGRSQQGGFARRGRDVELELPLFLEESQAGSTKPLSFSLPQRDELGRRVGETTKTLNVKIPAGSTDGERIRLKGQGEPGIGGAAAGDLYLVIRLVPHPVFDVDGQDLVVGVPLAPWEAALGAKVQVPTLDGQIMLSIPAGSQSGARLRVRGKGLAGKGGQGDLYALLKVVMPPKGDEETQALWRQLAERAAFDPRQDWRKVR
ncbi:curved DNA-binding protein [Pseudomonas psychrotolerans]|nr:curved DNA-binding protein [Pseudomonas psychrotolerans]